MRRTGFGRRLLAAAVLACFVPASGAACFGSFGLVRTVYDFNRDVSSDKWVRWLVFLVLNFIPVYGFSVWVDAVVLNSIEFWTGDNPVLARTGDRQVVEGPYGERAELRVLDDRRLRVEVTDAQGERHVAVLSRDHRGVSAFDARGRLLGRAGEVAAPGAPGL